MAADRADVLAALMGFDLDDRWLAANLLGPVMPHPLTELSAWRGVVAVGAVALREAVTGWIRSRGLIRSPRPGQ